ncbi:MAG: phosphoribosylglycinamide formyltransferase [Nitrososphaerota archaeon]|nr:phosphoribosylglycinamide formyltransferase [Nitrososphaerota archaeon]
MPKRILVFASGRGSDFQAILDHQKLGILKDVGIDGLVCNHQEAPVIQRAKNANIPVHLLEGVTGRHFGSSEERELARSTFEDKCLNLATSRSIDYIILAGFDQIVTSKLVEAYKTKILNIHPAYDMKRFGGKNMVGMKIHEAVIQSGASYSGCTVHFVTADVDRGPAILKRKVSIVSGETPESLERKILKIEHLAYPESIQLLVDNRVQVDSSGRHCFVDLYSDEWDVEWEARQTKYTGEE